MVSPTTVPRKGDDFRRALEEDDGKFPEAWIPKVGDVLIGIVLHYTSGPTEHGPCPIVVIQDDETDTPRSFWLLHTVARGEFAKLKPRPGERVGIKRLADSEKGYRRFVVKVDRPISNADVPDFSTFASPGDVAPEHRASLESEHAATTAQTPDISPAPESFEDVPEALDSDGDDDLPF
jgi:hypothetical protein